MVSSNSHFFFLLYLGLFYNRDYIWEELVSWYGGTVHSKKITLAMAVVTGKNWKK
jgi:hypothetical protein